MHFSLGALAALTVVALLIARRRPMEPPEIALLLTLCWLTATDIRYGIIPNGANIIVAASGLIQLAVDALEAIAAHLATAVVVLAMLVGLNAAFRAKRGRDGMGMGDVKLLAAGALWVGPFRMADLLLVSAGLGLAYALTRRNIAGKSATIPFGPFIAIGLWSTLLFCFDR